MMVFLKEVHLKHPNGILKGPDTSVNTPCVSGASGQPAKRHAGEKTLRQSTADLRASAHD